MFSTASGHAASCIWLDFHSRREVISSIKSLDGCILVLAKCSLSAVTLLMTFASKYDGRFCNSRISNVHYKNRTRFPTPHASNPNDRNDVCIFLHDRCTTEIQKHYSARSSFKIRELPRDLSQTRALAPRSRDIFHARRLGRRQ